ncbi:YdcF family protein [Vicingaceae bacterium]|nr:YdcF family protein [Vicingaceae bacterium]
MKVHKVKKFVKSESWKFLFTLAFIKFFKKILSIVKQPLKWITLCFGIIFIIIIILSFTTLPFWMYYDLSVSDQKLESEPKYIVVMSGSGIPSESGLMRTYYASEIAKAYPNTQVIVTMPGDTTDTNSACYLMKKELIIRGIERDRISFENIGTNTRSQAQEVKKIIKGNPSTLIITSPEHIYRSLATFNKVGLTKVTGHAAFEEAVEASFIFEDDELGGNNVVPNIGNNTQIRYQFWSHLKYQVIVYREYAAIAFYKLKGWI